MAAAMVKTVALWGPSIPPMDDYGHVKSTAAPGPSTRTARLLLHKETVDRALLSLSLTLLLS